MNIIKQTLIEKKQATVEQIDALLIERQIAFESRGAELLKPALEIAPEMNLVYQFNSFKVMSESKYSDLLSINKREYFGEEPTFYLNTYSTTIDSEFELKRLVLNGKIAEMFLNDSDLGAKMFEKTDLCLRLEDLRTECMALDRAISEIERQEQLDKFSKALERFMNGEKIELNKHVDFSYGYKKYDFITRVQSIRFLDQPKKGTVNVEAICKGWSTDEPVIQNIKNVKVKYVESFIHQNLAKMPA